MISWAPNLESVNWKVVLLVPRFQQFYIHFQTCLKKDFFTRTELIQDMKVFFYQQRRFMSRIYLPSKVASSAFHISYWDNLLQLLIHDEIAQDIHLQWSVYCCLKVLAKYIYYLPFTSNQMCYKWWRNGRNQVTAWRSPDLYNSLQGALFY